MPQVTATKIIIIPSTEKVGAVLANYTLDSITKKEIYLITIRFFIQL